MVTIVDSHMWTRLSLCVNISYSSRHGIDTSTAGNGCPRHTGHHMDIPTDPLPTYLQIQECLRVSDLFPNIARCHCHDLSLNLRGIGWSSSRFPNAPTESRPSLVFFLHTLVSFLLHVVMLDVTHRVVQLFGLTTIDSPEGGSIFDPSLPPLHRYSRSTLYKAHEYFVWLSLPIRPQPLF
jgi:hypothetical protein